MQVEIKSLAGNTGDEKMTLADEVFAVPYSEGLVHQVIVSYMAASRSGTKSNKGRSEVRGGGKKPWAQKGTGRARAGTSSSPIWRGGGVTFAATPRSFEKKVNRKMYRGAVRCILSEQIRKNTLLVVDEIKLKSHKTKDFQTTLNTLDANDALFITDSLSDNLYYASRNIPKVWAIDFLSVNPYDLFTAKKLVVTTEVMKKIEEWLS
jgi:large subunit ribosomal protein L4